MNTNTKTEYFAQVPHSVILANIPDKLKILLCYCYSNALTFRYNVPEGTLLLKADKRTTQRHFKTLIAAGILTATTPYKVKHGEIPNYLFNPQKVPVFIGSQPERTLAGLEMSEEPPTEPATTPATRPATQPPTDPATPDHANNNKKQEEETGKEKQECTNRVLGVALRSASSQPPTAELQGRDLGKVWEDFYYSDSPSPIPSRVPPAESVNMGSEKNNQGHPCLPSPLASTPRLGSGEDVGPSHPPPSIIARSATFPKSPPFSDSWRSGLEYTRELLARRNQRRGLNGNL